MFDWLISRVSSFLTLKSRLNFLFALRRLDLIYFFPFVELKRLSFLMKRIFFDFDCLIQLDKLSFLGNTSFCLIFFYLSSTLSPLTLCNSDAYQAGSCHLIERLLGFYVF